ncbi:MAG TPA: dihydrofolate reductase family protein [Egibacteraceae bacterium]|nr:dihydrofolate reductase family protein [Egibacteraceae bacterium]
MDQLLPERLRDVDPYELYRIPEADAASLRVHMVASVDGAATDEHGRTGALGGQADTEIFRVLRALADGILVGAGTVRVEGYGPHRLRADLRERREADGRSAPAPIVVVSRSLELDYAAPLFTEADVPTVVLTCAASPTGRRREAERAGRVVVAGEEEVDLVAGLARLRTDHGLAHVVCEGGPTLNVPLFTAGLVDELCITFTPRLIGEGPRILHELDRPRGLDLMSLCEEDGELYARYAVTG